jgi:putative lysine transport system permease protein
MAEIVRGGILSIDKGQTEAAHSIGMTHWQTMTTIILPQAIRCLIYFVMTFTVTRILRLIERKMAGSDSYTIHGSQTVPESEIKIRGGV